MTEVEYAPGSGRGQDGYCYYSQAVNAEYELRVPIYLGG
jgi:hypothetical protein